MKIKKNLNDLYYLIKQKRGQSKSWWQAAAAEHHNTHVHGNKEIRMSCIE